MTKTFSTCRKAIPKCLAERWLFSRPYTGVWPCFRLTYIILSTFLLTSCGLIDFDFNEVNEVAATLDLGRDTVYVMKGESYDFSPIFTPDTIANKQVFFESSADTVARIVGSTVEALSEGWTIIHATSVSGRLPDSCVVCVLPQWQPSERVYPYETVIYTYATVRGKPITDDMVIAAFCEGEVRAIGEPFEIETKDNQKIRFLRFRVGSTLSEDQEDLEDDEDDGEEDIGTNEVYRERISFRCYDRSRFDLYISPIRFVFDGKTHGKPSELVDLKL